MSSLEISWGTNENLADAVWVSISKGTVDAVVVVRRLFWIGKKLSSPITPQRVDKHKCIPQTPIETVRRNCHAECIISVAHFTGDASSNYKT